MSDMLDDEEFYDLMQAYRHAAFGSPDALKYFEAVKTYIRGNQGGEDQESISDWAVETFGEAGSNISCVARANKEMAELFQALAADDNHPKAGEEVADVVICLFRLAERLDVDLVEEIDKKMVINRAREWVRNGDGHGSHVKGT